MDIIFLFRVLSLFIFIIIFFSKTTGMCAADSNITSWQISPPCHTTDYIPYRATPISLFPIPAFISDVIFLHLPRGMHHSFICKAPTPAACFRIGCNRSNGHEIYGRASLFRESHYVIVWIRHVHARAGYS